MALISKPLDKVRKDVPTAALAGEPVRINLNTSKQNRAKWKQAAITLETNLTDMVHAAMEEYLKNHLKP